MTALFAQRTLVSSRIAERMFGEREALVAAIRLTELPGVCIDNEVEEVEYVHLLFDGHDVIYAEGAPSESLYTGPEALKSISADARQEIFTIFPELADPGASPKGAALIPSNKDQKRLVAQHVANGKAPLELFEAVGRTGQQGDLIRDHPEY